MADPIARPPGLLVGASVCSLSEEARGVPKVWAEGDNPDRRTKGLIGLALFLGAAVLAGYAVEKGNQP